MQAIFNFQGKEFKADLLRPIDISIPITNNPDSARAWYLDPPTIEPVRNDQFLGSVEEGGSVNFRNIAFNPHGHGTHTECVGHIAKTVHSVNNSLKKFFSVALLASIQPERIEMDLGWMKAGDELIFPKAIPIIESGIESLIIRTLPNSEEKLTHNYSSDNPPYLHTSAMELIVHSGIQNLLIDLPSVDRELDGGELRCHHLYWEHPSNTNLTRTITELIHVPNSVPDGIYLLELQVAAFENDASPSRPVLYPLILD